MNEKYNANNPLLAGTVVSAKYCDFENNEREGIFVVLYDEQFDNKIFETRNVIALKISSQTTLVSNYSVRILMDRNTFFLKPSIVCCSKVHLLNKYTQIYKVRGKLDSTTMKMVFKTFHDFTNSVEQQALTGV